MAPVKDREHEAAYPDQAPSREEDAPEGQRNASDSQGTHSTKLGFTRDRAQECERHKNLNRMRTPRTEDVSLPINERQMLSEE
jgi:hypothetical protein